MPKKKTNEEFLKEVYELVGNEYEFLEEYSGNRVKLKTIHRVCGNEIYITPKTFVHDGVRCSICAGNSPLTHEQVKKYIENTSSCKLLSSEYINSTSQIILECKCGNEFSTTFSYFKHENKQQCNDCGFSKRVEWKRLTYEAVKHFIEVETDNGFTLISDKYIDTETPLEITCSNGHLFAKRFNDFKQGSHCPDCSNLIKSENSRLPLKDVIEYIEKCGYKLLSDSYINSNEKLDLVCPYSHEFKMAFCDFKYGKQRCPACNSSKGEDIIRILLEEYQIRYSQQYKFDDCKHKRQLPFDFAIFDESNNLKLLIEYDGKQHFEPVEFYGGEEGFRQTQLRDSIKNDYCKTNNIRLLRIPYCNFDRIEEILSKELIRILGGIV